MSSLNAKIRFEFPNKAQLVKDLAQSLTPDKIASHFGNAKSERLVEVGNIHRAAGRQALEGLFSKNPAKANEVFQQIAKTSPEEAIKLYNRLGDNTSKLDAKSIEQLSQAFSSPESIKMSGPQSVYSGPEWSTSLTQLVKNDPTTAGKAIAKLFSQGGNTERLKNTLMKEGQDLKSVAAILNQLKPADTKSVLELGKGKELDILREMNPDKAKAVLTESPKIKSTVEAALKSLSAGGGQIEKTSLELTQLSNMDEAVFQTKYPNKNKEDVTAKLKEQLGAMQQKATQYKELLGIAQ
jgi:hypothetical protein